MKLLIPVAFVVALFGALLDLAVTLGEGPSASRTHEVAAPVTEAR
jgi:hypothetical protein